jgi:hypothetical protein
MNSMELSAGFEVITAVNIKSSVFCNKEPCSSVKVNCRSERAYLLCLLPALRWFLACITLILRRWRRYVPPKRRIGLHGYILEYRSLWFWDYFMTLFHPCKLCSSNAKGKIIMNYQSIKMWKADHGGRAVWGMNCLRPLERWDRGFESYSRHECLCVRLFCAYVVLYVGNGITTGWAHVQGVLPNVCKIQISEVINSEWEHARGPNPPR